MGFAENMRTLSNINCTLASATNYLEQRQNGVDKTTASLELFGNMTNGIIRNDIAYGMQKRGNPIGNTINLCAGYGNQTANTIGTLGLIGACSPWMFFNSYSYCFMPPPPPPPMFIGGYGGFGGCCHHPFMMGGGFFC